MTARLADQKAFREAGIDYSSALHDLCLLYTSDAADDLLCVDLGGRRIIKKKNQTHARTNPPLLSLYIPQHTTHMHNIDTLVTNNQTK